MCFLRSYTSLTKYTHMSVKSVCARSCISDSLGLGRHAEIISKAELDADLTEMMKPNKWNRSRNCTNNSKRRPRSFRGRKKSGSEEIRAPNQATPPQPIPHDENIMSIEDFVDSASERVPRIHAVTDLPSGAHKTKKVHFDEDHLVEVIEFPDDEESKEMRKPYWDVFARDRCRFKDRINQAEDSLKLVLLSEHRQKVYNQRFLPLMNT